MKGASGVGLPALPRIIKVTLAIALLSCSALALFSGPAVAADFQWNGEFRAEGNYIKNFTLDHNAGIEDSYLQDHLVLEPKIIAADGLNIKARFDVMNNGLYNNMGGQVMGQYAGSSAATGPLPSGVLTQTEQPDTFLVNGLYLNWVNEFGALIVGRVPLQFGLGMTYSSGEGMFDHYITNRDMVAYKLALGNISIMPAYSKVREGFLTNEDDLNEYMVMAEYSNPESDLSLGILFADRVAPQDGASPAEGNDFPLTYFNGVSPKFGAQVQDQGGSGYNAYNLNFYVKKKSDNFDVGVELGFMNGYSGTQVFDNNTGGYEQVNFASFGGAVELAYRTGDFTLNLKTGMANGDDPDTATIEGYAFNPNYNVAMLMFNYPVGYYNSSNGTYYDALRSSLYGSRAGAGTSLYGLDTEVITNAAYFAPSVNWAVGEHFDLLANFCYGLEIKPPYSSSSTYGNISQSLGFETDLGINFHPSDKFTWSTAVGILVPGGAYAGGNANFATDLAYGATSKAAISF